jgi:hypothetical protein
LIVAFAFLGLDAFGADFFRFGALLAEKLQHEFVVGCGVHSELGEELIVLDVLRQFFLLVDAGYLRSWLG